MPVSAHITMEINGNTISDTQWTWGSDYPKARRWQDGWGTSIEVPAVIEMLELVTMGKASAGQVREALAQAAQRLNSTHDRDYGNPAAEAVARCYGDCQRCLDREAEVRRDFDHRLEQVKKARSPEYQYVVSGRIAHSTECRRVLGYDRLHWPGATYEEAFRNALHAVVHDDSRVEDTYEPVTWEGLVRWCEANTGPQGGRYYRACKTCKVQIP